MGAPTFSASRAPASEWAGVIALAQSVLIIVVEVLTGVLLAGAGSPRVRAVARGLRLGPLLTTLGWFAFLILRS